MKRATAIALLRVAGYHDDRKTLLLLPIRARVSRQAANEAFTEGRRAKLLGWGCSCAECRSEGGAR